jgi:nitroimidazol reductase NimA-like FMN-containing flavoprotein (pyridoxamine 5'-phosphate oxidase superfamily)
MGRENMSEHEKPDVPEIFTKKVSRPLASEELEERIMKFLASRQLCVLSTCQNNEPRSTPILFRTKGFTLFMLANRVSSSATSNRTQG